MKYKGEVTLTFKNKYGESLSVTHHNGGTLQMQLAFANMLSGYSTAQFVPKYISGGFGVYQVTGLNRFQETDSQNNVTRYYVRCSAIVPIDGSIDDMLSSDYVYSLCGQREDIVIATFTPNNDDISREEIETFSRVGLQLNISWKLYLEVDE